MTDILDEIKAALPPVLLNEVLAFFPDGSATHKYRLGAVLLTIDCYDHFDLDEFIPSEVKVVEQHDLRRIKIRFPKLWQKPGFITHEMYYRGVILAIEQRGRAPLDFLAQRMQQVFHEVVRPAAAQFHQI